MMNCYAQKILDNLRVHYPNAHCELDYKSDFELLIAVILSAQCTDKRVNVVTKQLFKEFNTPQAILSLSTEQLENFIKSCGLYHSKAKNIMKCCQSLIEKHDGKVPDTFEKLIDLGGVGRKTANVMLSVAFNKSAIAVDTHVFRVSRRLGLSSGETVKSVELDLMDAFEPKDYSQIHHLLIFHGRYCCKAQNPQCAVCPVADLCPSNNVKVN